MPTSGRIVSGAIVEREIDFDLASLEVLNIALRNPDLTTARHVAQAINRYLDTAASVPVDPATVRLFFGPRLPMAPRMAH